MVATTLLDVLGTIGLGIVYLIIALVVGYGVMLLDKRFLNPEPKDDEILYKEPDMIVTEEEQKLWEEYEAKYGTD